MPYEVIQHGDYLLLRLSGKLSRQDLQGITEDMRGIERTLAVTPHRVVDTTSVERFELPFESVFQFAEDRRKHVLKNPIKSAFIVNTPVALGMSRMFQTLNDHPQITIRTVESLEEALSWFSAG